MYAGHSRRARGRALIVGLSLVASGAFAAPAGAATVQVTSATVTAEQSVPVQLAFSGTADPGNGSFVQAVVRPGGGLDCQPDFQSDVAAAGSADTDLDTTQTLAPGPYTVNATFRPPSPGSYQVCAWLAETVGGVTETVAGPSTISFAARAPQVSQLTLAVAPKPLPNLVYQLVYTTQTDQQLSLYSVIKKAGALPCASSYELEQQEDQPEKDLFGQGGPQVFGGPAQTTVTDKEKAGSYVICSWIEGPNAAESDASLTTPLTIATAPPATTTTPAALGLRLGRVSASRRRGVSVAGVTATGFTDRLLVAVSCGSSHTRARARVKRGRFSATLELPSGCRGKQRVKVSASWAGSATFQAAVLTRSIVIKV